MNIRLHIERLVLDGLPLAQAQGPQVQAAVELELARLLAESGLASHLASGAALPSINGGSIQLAGSVNPSGLGEQIAGAVYTGLGAQR